jgi:hypothetical protein
MSGQRSTGSKNSSKRFLVFSAKYALVASENHDVDGAGEEE